MEHSRDAIALLDGSARVLWISPVVETLLGYARTEMIGMLAFELVHPDDLELALAEAAKAVASPAPIDPVRVRLRNAAGGWQPIELAAGLVPDADGNQHLAVNLRDVTWQVDAARRLEASERRLRSLIEHSPSTVMLLDERAHITWVSDNVRELLGYEPAAVVGEPTAAFIHEEDLATTSDAVRKILTIPDDTVTFETRTRHAGGGWRWLEATFANRLADESIGGIVANVRDITDRKVAEMALHDSERRFKSLARSSPVGIYQQDLEGNCTYVNERWEHITGRRAPEALGGGWRDIVHPDDRSRLGVDDLGQRAPREAEFRIVRPDGSVRWISARSAVHLHDDGTIAGVVGTIEDITGRVDAQRDAQRLLDIFEATADLVGIADPGGEMLYVNARAKAFFSADPDTPPHRLIDLFPPEEANRIATEIIPSLDEVGMWSGELVVVRHDGEQISMLAQLLAHRGGDGHIEFFSGVLHDISERKQFETALAHQATHDPLTGLPNRTLLLTRLDDALTRARLQRSRVAVLFVDLDHFKVVNDSLGHGLGDQLLVAITERLREALRPGDTIARFGGDEFVVLCEDLHARGDAVAIAERVIASVSGAFDLGDTEIFIGVSLGIAFPDDPDADPGTLIRDADAAMYRAKERGRGRYEIFDNAMRASAVDRLDIENFLRRALERRELRVHYQPIIDLGSSAVIGVEALLRWEHPERGLLQPADFIGVAEETGLIVPIGSWVIEQSCRQARRWDAAHPAAPPLDVAVNLSGRQLGHPGLVADVRRVLTDTGLEPARLELEITESVLMDDVETSEETLVKLRELGVRVAVDDFGTGYSSLSYLRRFPVNRLKVDRSFVAGLGSDASDSAIVTAIVTLAHTLGLDALAEGVETEEQFDELRRLGCDTAQGFFFARPTSSEGIADLLESMTPG